MVVSTPILAKVLSFILSYNLDSFHEILVNPGNQELSQFVSDFSVLDSSVPKSKLPTFVIHSIETSNDNKTFNASKSFLSNRWRSMKWILSQTVSVASESPEFVKQALWLYGPNISEASTIFSIMPAELIKEESFRRDVMFRKMYPTFILIRTSDQYFAVQVVCILCANPLSLSQFQVFDYSDIGSIKSLLKGLHHNYNLATGHGSMALLCQVGFRGDIRNAEYHRKLESTAWKHYNPAMDKVAISLGIVIQIFNFTVEIESWENEEGNYSGIYLNPGGDMPSKNIYGRYLTVSYIIREFMMYCRKVAIIGSTGWDFLWSPFDLFTWTGILMTCVVFFVYHRFQISYGIDVFWGVLGLPYTSDWRDSKLLSCVLVVLINLNVGYLSVITSKIIIPNKEPDIETPAELFRQKFRFIDGNVSRNGPTFKNYWGKFLASAKVNISDMSNILVQVDSCGETHQPRCISQWAGLATGVLYSHEKQQKLLQVPVEMRDKCHGVKTPIRSYMVSFYSQGPLATSIYKAHHALVTTGIEEFWDGLKKTMSLYVAYREANHSTAEIPPKLNFQTPILVVFKAYGVLISVCMLVFPIELVWGKFSKCCCSNRKGHHKEPQPYPYLTIGFQSKKSGVMVLSTFRNGFNPNHTDKHFTYPKRRHKMQIIW